MGDSASIDLIDLLSLFATDNGEINTGKCNPPLFIFSFILMVYFCVDYAAEIHAVSSNFN